MNEQNPAIHITFNAKKAEVTIHAVNAPDDREVIHEAFKRALKRSKFKSREIRDIGEQDARPIRTGKEQIISTETEHTFE